jgi:hypothetical protein
MNLIIAKIKKKGSIIFLTIRNVILKSKKQICLMPQSASRIKKVYKISEPRKNIIFFLIYDNLSSVQKLGLIFAGKN